MFFQLFLLGILKFNEIIFSTYIEESKTFFSSHCISGILLPFLPITAVNQHLHNAQNKEKERKKLAKTTEQN